MKKYESDLVIQQLIETNQKLLLEKLSKHIDFIDETYEGLRNPIQAAKRFLGKK